VVLTTIRAYFPSSNSWLVALLLTTFYLQIKLRVASQVWSYYVRQTRDARIYRRVALVQTALRWSKRGYTTDTVALSLKKKERFF
jgi:hypothetical protein